MTRKRRYFILLKSADGLTALRQVSQPPMMTDIRIPLMPTWELNYLSQGGIPLNPLSKCREYFFYDYSTKNITKSYVDFIYEFRERV